jgi:Holliday junction DNA helicase RuvA
MIRQISGIVADIGISFVVVDVGGVGYLVYTNSPSSHLLDAPIRLFTHLAVRENSLDLYGFPDRDTLEIFELLIDLPKIGPKSALQILTQADISLLREAVHNDDPGYLSKLSGIGKKSAEKIVSGLKDKFESRGYDEVSIRSSGSAPTHTSDTIDALIALGYPAMDARRIVLEIAAEDPSLTSSADTIKIALKLLNNR